MQQGIEKCYIKNIRVPGAKRINLDPMFFTKSYLPAGAVREKSYRDVLIGYSGTLEVYNLPEELFAGDAGKLYGVSMSYEIDGKKYSYADCDITIPSIASETKSNNPNIIPYTLPIVINL